MSPLRPARVCGALLLALDASEGRRRRRKRDTTPDALGLALKRQLLIRAVEADPDPDEFEAWLLGRCLARAEDDAIGAMRAIAGEIVAEWGLASACPEFRTWLMAGARSEDRT